MEEFKILACTHPALADPAVAIAASRAGALGVLDLEYHHNIKTALRALSKLSQFARGPCGIKLDSTSADFAGRITEKHTPYVEWVVLTSFDGSSITSFVNSLHHRNLNVLIEVKSLDEALVAVDSGADGLIAKGNESGGFVGTETAFVLLQRLLKSIELPVWVQGGIGLHTAAACRIAGAAGVVLDSQLLLTRESSIPDDAKEIISRMDGSETRCFGIEIDAPIRVYHRPAFHTTKQLVDIEKEILLKSASDDEKKAEWYQLVRNKVGWNDPNQQIILIGQDAAFASQLAERFVTTGGILRAVQESIESHLYKAQSTK